MNFDRLIEWAKNFAVIAGGTVSLVTLLGIAVKPLRKRFLRWFIKVTHSEEIKMLDEKITEIEISTNKEISNLSERIDGIEKEYSTALTKIAEKIDDIAADVSKNEAGRLRGELFNYGNRCRRGIPLYTDEFRYVQTIWTKYNKVLHENGIGEEEYKYISKYFNSQYNQGSIRK